MARANTYELETKGFGNRYGCKICGSKEGVIVNRIFFNPTYMNGDAEWIADFCENHKEEAKKVLTYLLEHNK